MDRLDGKVKMEGGYDTETKGGEGFKKEDCVVSTGLSMQKPLMALARTVLVVPYMPIHLGLS